VDLLAAARPARSFRSSQQLLNGRLSFGSDVLRRATPRNEQRRYEQCHGRCHHWRASRHQVLHLLVEQTLVEHAAPSSAATCDGDSAALADFTAPDPVCAMRSIAESS
jgi:hypothetical protein